VRNDPVGRGACPDRVVLQKARVTILFSVGLRKIAKMLEPAVDVVFSARAELVRALDRDVEPSPCPVRTGA